MEELEGPRARQYNVKMDIKQAKRVWNGFIWLRLENESVPGVKGRWTFGFHTMRDT